MASPTKKSWNKRNHRDAKLRKKRNAKVRRAAKKAIAAKKKA